MTQKVNGITAQGAGDAAENNLNKLLDVQFTLDGLLSLMDDKAGKQAIIKVSELIEDYKGKENANIFHIAGSLLWLMRFYRNMNYATEMIERARDNMKDAYKYFKSQEGGES